MFFEREKLYCYTLYFSLRIMKFLQLHGRRQIAELRKYYLMYDYFSLVYIFSLFLHFIDLEISYIFPSYRILQVPCRLS